MEFLYNAVIQQFYELGKGDVADVADSFKKESESAPGSGAGLLQSSCHNAVQRFVSWLQRQAAAAEATDRQHGGKSRPRSVVRS